METLIDYKLKDFLQLKDESRIRDSLFILELLKPLRIIKNPKKRFWNREPRTIEIGPVRDLLFCDVTNIRHAFNDGSTDAILEAVELATGLSRKQLLRLRISQFYGLLAAIKEDVIAIHHMEESELSDVNFDINLELVNAKERMARYGTLNILDSLANGDILRWQEIEKLPYMTVFTKLKMDREKSNIQHEITQIQKQKLKQQ